VPVLRAERALDDGPIGGGEPAYAPLGTHWSDRAMYGVYRAFVDRLARTFPALTPIERPAMLFRPHATTGDSWDRRMFLEGWLVQRQRVLDRADAPPWRVAGPSGAYGADLKSACDVPSAPRAFVYHDSFGEPLRRMLAYHFSAAMFAWERGFDTERILSEKPAVVIQLYTARFLAVGVPPPLADGEEALNAFDARFRSRPRRPEPTVRCASR
jgi:alginate O-acetyltransferase complex protein AlgJ